jgi:leucyl-tRNA synthetase
MGVPAHDERDWLFAKERGLSIREVMIPYRYYKPNPPREGKKSVTRRNVHAIVRNPQTGKILALRWKKFPWTTFPMGGIDNGEDIVEAARREVREETGYKNLLPVRILGGQVKAEYFAAHKDENRISFTSAVLFDLRDEEREKVDAEESDKHEVFWMNQSDMKPEIMTHAELDVWLSRLDKENSAYTGDGVLINSGKFSGMTSAEAKQKITESVGGKMTTSYKLRDWTVSRQRYWGVPIPVVQCKKCGYVPVKEKDLPVELPEIKDYKPTGDGKSPLAKAEKWKRVKCPQCGGLAERETDTLDTFVDSSWYFLRYTDPKNKKVFASSTKMKNWLPVNFYSGGAEHTTMHLLYSRFWHKALYDCGLVVDTEPYVRRLNRGLIMGPDGQKMSKSRGNVIDPDAEVARLGADTVRLYLAFIGPYNETGNYPWNPQGAIGVRRFLERVWRLGQNFYSESDKREAKRILQMSGASGRSEATRAFPRTLQNAISRSALLHQTIKKVGEAIETFKMNTGVSALMILLNEFEKQETVSGEDYKIFLRLLAPFAPHLAEELWAERGQRTSIHKEPWPLYDPKRAESERVTVVVQVDGRVRGSFQAERGLAEADALLRAKTIPDIAKHLIGKTPSKHIYIPDRLINIVAE